MMRLSMILPTCSLLAMACGTEGGTGSPGAGPQPPKAGATAADAERPDGKVVERFSQIPPELVDPQRRAAAESFATSYEESRAQGSFSPLGADATDELRAALDANAQKATQQRIEAELGKYRALEFVGAWRANASPGSTIYRFRATFTKGRPEIRVVHDAAGKVSGYWIKPWRDSLEPPRPQKLPEDQVNTALRDASREFANDYLERCKAGRFEVLGNQATDELRAALTPELQQRAHADITSLAGEYRSLTYVETYRIEGEPVTTVFRFRGTFSAGRPEVRVVRDAEGKVSGLWIKPWQDSLD